MILLNKNSPEILDKLKSKGYEICICCNFKDNIWLNYSTTTKSFHGLGCKCENDCENVTPEDCIKCAIKDDLKYNHTCLIFTEIDKILDYLNINLVV